VPDQQPVVAKSIEDEEAQMGTCECRGAWSLVGEWLRPSGGRWFDELRVQCVRCGHWRTFRFDVTSFFRPRPRLLEGN
jgi:hypothetical protein